MHLIARIVDIFKLTLLTIFVSITDVWRALITPLTCPNTSNWLNVSQSMSSFDAIRYVNIIKTFKLLLMIVLGIYGKFLIDLLICLKTCRSDFFFSRQNVHARKTEILYTWARPTGIRRAICPGLTLKLYAKWDVFKMCPCYWVCLKTNTLYQCHFYPCFTPCAVLFWIIGIGNLQLRC